MSNQKSYQQFVAEERFEHKTYDYYILAEGDSWFNIPYIPSVGKVRNLLDPIIFDKNEVIVNLARSGDEIVQMDVLRNHSDYLAALDYRKWDLILLSGGGNDLIDAIAGNYVGGTKYTILKPSLTKSNDYMKYIDDYSLQKLLSRIADAYVDIASRRDSIANGKNKNSLIITHCYDYIQPRNAPVEPTNYTGPWVYSSLVVNKIPEIYWDQIADYIFSEFRKVMFSLATSRISNFIVLDTQGTLIKALPHTSGNSNDWKNEIHPNEEGFKKLVKVHFQNAVDKSLSRKTIQKRFLEK